MPLIRCYLLSITPVNLQEFCEVGCLWRRALDSRVNTSTNQRSQLLLLLYIWNSLLLGIRSLSKSYTPLLYKLLNLTFITVVGLGATPNRFLERTLHKFSK